MRDELHSFVLALLGIFLGSSKKNKKKGKKGKIVVADVQASTFESYHY